MLGPSDLPKVLTRQTCHYHKKTEVPEWYHQQRSCTWCLKSRKGEKGWTICSESFDNQLNTLYITLGFPLTYVIQKLEIPDGTVVYSTFVEECIARAPLIGINYEADTRQFHQLILSSTQGQPSHEWIKPLMRVQNESYPDQVRPMLDLCWLVQSLRDNKLWISSPSA